MAEMRRRHVVRFSLAYAAVAFVVLQLAEIVFPAFGIDEGGLRLLVAVTTLGFPPSLILAWMYDLTTEGIKRTGDADAPNPFLTKLALSGLLIITVGATGALGLYMARQGIFETTAGEITRAPVSTPVTLATYDPEEPIRSIAVLPLDDFSPDGDQAYFTASMLEELIAKLSSLEEIRVVSRTSVTQYAGTTLTSPEIGRELGADVLVEGSVIRTPSRTRVTLQLIHAPSDSHIQTLQWDRENVEDILAFQTEIAHDVLHEVSSHEDETEFVRTASNVDPAAQDAYFRGRYEYEQGTPEGYRTAFEFFEEALEEDPGFAEAMAGMAGARFLMGLEESDISEDEVTIAHQEAMAALQLDSSSAEAREVLTLIERSMPQFVGQPVIPAPDSPNKTVHVVALPGQSDSIVIKMEAFDSDWVPAATSIGERIEARVRQVSGMSVGTSSSGTTHEVGRLLASGRYSKATELLEELVEESPETSHSWSMLARTHVATGDPEDAAGVMQDWHDSGSSGAPDDAQVAALWDAVEAEGTEGYWEWNLERLDGLRAEGGDVTNMDFASTYAALGNSDMAFQHLIAALEGGEPGIFSIRSDPAWDDLRSDPRIREIGRQAQMMRFSPSRRGRRGGG